MSINFSIIIPCYNEKENLSQLITICKQELCSNGVEVILIDNGSNDDSQNILNKIDNSKGLLKTYKLWWRHTFWLVKCHRKLHWLDSCRSSNSSIRCS